jgi:hypothetical protein
VQAPYGIDELVEVGGLVEEDRGTAPGCPGDIRGIEAGAEDECLCVWIHVAQFADEVAAVTFGQAEVDDRDVMSPCSRSTVRRSTRTRAGIRRATLVALYRAGGPKGGWFKSSRPDLTKPPYPRRFRASGASARRCSRGPYRGSNPPCGAAIERLPQGPSGQAQMSAVAAGDRARAILVDLAVVAAGATPSMALTRAARRA